MDHHRAIDWRKYVSAFVITCVIFFTAIFIANFLNNKKVAELQAIQNQIATDLLSSEVQTSLLQEFSCKDAGKSVLSEQLGSLGDRLAATEEARGVDDPEVVNLKRNYSLLEIKDFLLMSNVNEKCGAKNVSIIYFYTKDCPDCERQGYVLTKLRADYPALRVYSFDYGSDVSAVKTLISINRLQDKLPALIVGDDVYYGFKSLDDIAKIIPDLKKLKVATTTPQS